MWNALVGSSEATARASLPGGTPRGGGVGGGRGIQGKIAFCCSLWAFALSGGLNAIPGSKTWTPGQVDPEMDQENQHYAKILMEIASKNIKDTMM